jgi:hypothetical protein
MKDWEITVTGAYGRDYETSDEAFAAWMADKDFCIHTPGHASFINKSDAEKFGVPNDLIRIRYKKASELVLVHFNKVTGEWTKGEDTEEELEEIEED